MVRPTQGLRTGQAQAQGGGGVNVCDVEDCERPARSLGYCRLHYRRYWLHGDVHQNHYDRTPSERFWSKVDKSGDCWKWTASKNPHGYGRFKLNGKVESAHRVSYEWANGPIPDGMMLDHRCHMTSCVKPAHLRLATSKQNQENRNGWRNSGTLRGVSWHKARGKWFARVRHNRRMYSAGYHATQELAAEAARQLRLSLYTHNDADRKTA